MKYSYICILFVTLLSVNINAHESNAWVSSVLHSKQELQGEMKGDLPYFSPVMRNDMEAIPVSLDITGLQELVLTTWGTQDGSTWDHGVFANARLIKANGEVIYLNESMMISGYAGWKKPLFDINSVNQILNICGQKYEHGVFLHANGQAIFQLNKQYVRFEAELGMEQRAKKGSAILGILATNPNPYVRELQQNFATELAIISQYLPQDITSWLLSKTNIPEEIALDALISKLNDAPQLRQEFTAIKRNRMGGIKKSEQYLELLYRTCWANHYKEQLAHVNLEAIQAAFDDMSKNANYDIAENKNYLDYIRVNLSRLEKDISEASLAVLERAKKLFDYKRKLLISNPLLDFDRLLAVKYNLTDNARTAMGPHIGTRANNWSSHPSQRRNGFDCEIVEISNLRGQQQVKTLFKPSTTAPISDICLHWDADRFMFSSVNPNGRWQVFEMDTTGAVPKEVVSLGEQDLDFFEAVYLPNGKIIVNSTIGYHGVPCVNGDDQVANLGLYDPKTNHYRRLNFGQDSDWDPVVMNNGRVMYLRWEYTDLTHYFSRIMMHMNPDGTNKKELYGSGSFWPNAMFDAQPLPGKDNNQFVAIVSGHHGVARSGRMITFDPKKGRMETQGVMQEFPYSKRPVVAEMKDELVNGVWPQFLNPKPLSEKYFLVTAKLNPNALWAVYLVDVFDNMTPLIMAEGQAIPEVVPIMKKETPPTIPERVKLDEKEATVYIQDLYEGIGTKGLPQGSIKSLRIFAYEFAYVKSPSNHMAQGIQSGWDIKRLLGTVPVEEDGSVTFKVPANVPISLQPLDENGAALQWMRSWFTAMPGEILSCVGCHEDQNSIAIPKHSIASRKSPVAIKVPEGGVRPFTFQLEVQPLLDKRCVSCHNGSKPGRPNFKDTENDPGLLKQNHEMSKSYLALHPYVHRQGPEADIKVLRPMEYHASTSDLVQLLEKGHYGVELSPEEWEVLYNWIDFNAPYNSSFRANKLFEHNQITRRRELMSKYNDIDVNWQEEIKNYENYLKSKGEITAVHPKHTPAPTMKTVKSKKFPFSLDEAKKKQASLGETSKQIEIAPGVTLKLTRIPKGEFIMGDNSGHPVSQPEHKVKINKDFWIGSFEITNEQFNVFFPEHDSRYTDQYWKDHVNPGYPSNLPQQPVIRISWDEAMHFCEQLSKKTGYNVTLPTEPQWEWAARCGQAYPFWYGRMNSDFSKYENMADDRLRNLAVSGINPQPMAENNPWKDYFDFIPRVYGVDDGQMIAGDVGQYTPSPWGLHDIFGNVQEWTRSDYKPYPYQTNDGRENPNSRERKVVRGGSWRDRPSHASASFRRFYQPYQKVYNVGFRIVIEE